MRAKRDVAIPLLVMHAEQEDDAEDDGGEKDLSDMVVEDLLIRVRGVADARLCR